MTIIESVVYTFPWIWRFLVDFLIGLTISLLQIRTFTSLGILCTGTSRIFFCIRRISRMHVFSYPTYHHNQSTGIRAHLYLILLAFACPGHLQVYKSILSSSWHVRLENLLESLQVAPQLEATLTLHFQHDMGPPAQFQMHSPHESHRLAVRLSTPLHTELQRIPMLTSPARIS